MPANLNQNYSMSSAHRIPFGVLPDGVVVDAYSVERGLACNCICPGCKQPLMSKQGEIRVYHFSHVGDRSCSNGQETALHLAAKQVLARERRMALPDLVVTVERTSRFGVKRRKTLRAPQGSWQFEAVELELLRAGNRADVAGIAADGTAGFVEIRVTAAADAVKRDFYKQANLRAVEVNLSSLLGLPISMLELTSFVCDQVGHKAWIHHPGFVELENQAIEALKAAEPPLPATPPADRGRSSQDRPTARPSHDDTRGLSPELLAIRREHERYRALSIEQKWGELYSGLGLCPDRWPVLLDARVEASPPAITFSRRLWQGAVFQRFVLNATRSNYGQDVSFYPSTVAAWCKARFGVSFERMPDLQCEVGGFLRHLVQAGYLKRAGDKYEVVNDQLPSS